MKLILTIAVTMLLAACSAKTNVAAPMVSASAPLEGHASVNGLVGFGTLCSGEFECATAPLYTKIAVIAYKVEAGVANGSIAVDEAQSYHDQAQKAQDLLDAATKACAANPKSGKCAPSTSVAAHAQVQQAAAILATFK